MTVTLWNLALHYGGKPHRFQVLVRPWAGRAGVRKESDIDNLAYGRRWEEGLD